MMIFIKSKHYMVIQMMMVILVIRMCVYIYARTLTCVFVRESETTLWCPRKKKGILKVRPLKQALNK